MNNCEITSISKNSNKTHGKQVVFTYVLFHQKRFEWKNEINFLK